MFGNKMNAIEKAIKKKNVGPLIELAGNKDESLSMAAIDGMAAIGGMDASNYLVTRLHDEDPKVRVAVANALGKIADVHTKAFLFAQMNKETDPKVKAAIGEAMALIKDY
ncbi:MAG TPA: HEAT repeat domain-containing protein [Candidatus Limiplasma sp.]|nr:HEAT repeat domain-containing protein [Candidatus Limiplasma sp.]